MIENWRQRNKCQPFSENGNLYIVVNSEYESLGNQKDLRLGYAVEDGINSLLRFYGKVTDFDTVRDLNDVSEAQDYFVSYKSCVPMKVLVKVPKSNFDQVPDDLESCDIYKPPEGYFEARLSIYEYTEKINFIVENLESYLPIMARSSKFISNVNVLAEIKRLKKTINIIDRYMILNGLDKLQQQYNPCLDPSPSEGTDTETTLPYNPPDKKIIIGYTFDYKVAFVLIDGDQHTIGYDCFIENDILNHTTTANFLINMQSMYDFISSSGENTFDIFDFYLRFLIPTPIIKTKQKNSDGLPLYDENGITFGFSDLAKLLSLELDVNLCKTAEQLAEENNRLLSAATRRDLRDSANQITKLVGDYKLSSQGFQNLRNTITNIGNTSGDEAIRKIYNDVLSKVDIGCAVNDALRCYIDKTVELAGEQVVDGDDDLGELINLSFTLGAIVDARCGFTACDGSPDVDFSVGFPVFQGIQIPTNFPTLDYLSDVIDEALNKLYAALIGALTSAILNVLNNSCSLLFDDVLGEGDAANSIKSGFQDWFSQSIGINYQDLNNPEAWKDALVSSGGSGFLGAVGNMVSKGVASGVATYEDTGVSFNLPNPQNGWEVEEVFISPQTLTQFFSELQSATQDINALTSPSEQVSLYKGSASDETVKLAFGCIKLRLPNFAELFEDEFQFADMFMELGKLVKPEYLQLPPEVEKVPPRNFCELGDGSEARILRAAILADKDINMPKSEIDAIIDKEIEYNTEKIKSLYETLDQVLNGNFAPSFPNLFGGEGALIPETPDVIDEIMRSAAAGSFGGAINNFNATSTAYSDIWNNLNDPTGLGFEAIQAYTAFAWERTYDETRSGEYIDGRYTYGFYTAEERGSTGIDTTAYTSATAPEFEGGINNILITTFTGNFKKDDPEFLNDMVAKFGADGFIPNSIIHEQILDFIEENDDSGDEKLSSVLLFDPDNTLIAYSIITYREGGFGSIFTTKYEVFITQTVYDAGDQPSEGSVTYDYGNLWEPSDSDNMKYLLGSAFPELYSNSELAKAIVAYAADDMDEFKTVLITGAATGTVALFAAPITYAIGFALAANNAALFSAGMFLAMGPGALILAGVVGLVAAIVFLVKLFADPPPRATRLMVPGGGGTAVTYDIVADNPGGKVTVTKRQIPSDLIASVGSYPSSWPAEIVSLRKAPGPEIVYGAQAMMRLYQPNLQDRTEVTAYEQNYLISPNIADFSLKQMQTGLGLTNYQFATDYEYQNSGLLAQQGMTRKHSFAAAEFGKMIAETLTEYFPDSSATATIEEISEAIKDKFSDTGQFGLNNLLFQQLQELIITNRYWTADSLADVNLNYPFTDIFKYAELNNQQQQFAAEVLRLQNQDLYCDELSATRRTNVTFAIIMLIRTFIIEQALISIQVLDSLDPTMMNCELFVEHIFNLIKKETDIDRNVFDLENRIFTDLVNNAVTYYEILKALDEEVPVFRKAQDYLKEMIREQITLLVPQIGRSLPLTHTYSTWDAFISNQVFSEFDAPESTSGDVGGQSTVNKHTSAKNTGGPDGMPGIEFEIHVKGNTRDPDGEADWYDPFELWAWNWTGEEIFVEPPQQGPGSNAATLTITKHPISGKPPTGLQGYFGNFPNELATKIREVWDPWVAENIPTYPRTSPDQGGNPFLYGPNVPISQESFQAGGIREPTLKNGWYHDASIDGYLYDTIDGEDWIIKYQFDIDGTGGTTKYKIKLNIASELDYADRGIIDDALLTPFAAGMRIAESKGLSAQMTDPPDGFVFERYIKAKPKNRDYTVWGPEAFMKALTDHYGENNQADHIFDDYEYINFGYRMNFIVDNEFTYGGTRHGEGYPIRDLLVTLDPSEGQLMTDRGEDIDTYEAYDLWRSHARSAQEKALLLYNQNRVVNGVLSDADNDPETPAAPYAYDFASIPLLSYECEYAPMTDPTANVVAELPTNPTIGDFMSEMNNRYESQIYLGVKEDFFKTDEYKRLINLIFPLQEMCVGFMMYQYNVLSDGQLFTIANTADSNLYNIMARSKISILQILQSAIYGSGKPVYDDPFTKKAGS